MTYKEQERFAYITGDTQKAALLRALMDAKEDAEDAREELFSAQTWAEQDD